MGKELRNYKNIDGTALARLNYKSLKVQHLERKVMTISNIAYLIAKIMKNHIGLEKRVSSDTLFKLIYMKERKPDYVDDFRWDFVRKAMHKLRQSSKLFIVSIRDEKTKEFSYFVPTTTSEAQIYINALENNIKRQRAMQQKVMKSVNEGWYKIDWIEDSPTLLAYEEAISKRQIEIKQETKPKKLFGLL